MGVTNHVRVGVKYGRELDVQQLRDRDLNHSFGHGCRAKMRFVIGVRAALVIYFQAEMPGFLIQIMRRPILETNVRLPDAVLEREDGFPVR